MNGVERFKKTIIVFWALWWSIAFITDFNSGLNHMGLTHISWASTSNYTSIVNSVAFISTNKWISVFLYSGIIVWLFVSATAFIIASFYIVTKPKSAITKSWVNRAFIISLTLWLMFFLADQIIMNFNLAQNHMVQGGFELLTYLTFSILTNRHVAHNE